jgi:hypothetical protein
VKDILKKLSAQGWEENSLSEQDQAKNNYSLTMVTSPKDFEKGLER